MILIQANTSMKFAVINKNIFVPVHVIANPWAIVFAFKYCFTTTKTRTAEKLIRYHGHVIFFMGLVIYCLAGGCDEVGLVEILRLLTARDSIAVESVTGESDDIFCCLWLIRFLSVVDTDDNKAEEVSFIVLRWKLIVDVSLEVTSLLLLLLLLSIAGVFTNPDLGCSCCSSWRCSSTVCFLCDKSINSIKISSHPYQCTIYLTRVNVPYISPVSMYHISKRLIG